MKRFVLILVLFLTTSFSALAKPKPSHQRLKPHELIQKNAESWGISTDTLHKIIKLGKEARPIKDRHHEKLRAARNLLHRLLDQDSPSIPEVMSQVETVGLLETQLRKHSLTVLIEMRSLLTPQQREKLKQVMPHPPGTRRHPKHKH